MKKKKKSFVEIFPSLDSYNFDKILSSSIFISFSSLKCSLFELLFFNRNSFTFTLLWKKILKISSRKFPIPILETRQRPPWSVLF